MITFGIFIVLIIIASILFISLIFVPLVKLFFRSISDFFEKDIDNEKKWCYYIIVKLFALHSFYSSFLHRYSNYTNYVILFSYALYNNNIEYLSLFWFCILYNYIF